MLRAAFVAQCPYEIGDAVEMYNPQTGEAAWKIITDIVCIHSLRKKTVEFWLELDRERPLVKLNMPEQKGTVQ